MSPFDEMNVATPRSEEICQRFVRRMDPWWGFVIGALLYTVVAMFIMGLAIVVSSEWFGIENGSRGAQVTSFAATLRNWHRQLFGESAKSGEHPNGP